MSILKNDSPHKDKTILVLDDDPTLLKFFKIHLNKIYTHVFIAENAQHAHTLIDNNVIDIIITDIRMPKTNGFQFLKKVKNKDASIPVILLSGQYFESDSAILSSQADGFLAKPFEIEELTQIIQTGFELRDILRQLKALSASNAELLRLMDGKLPKSIESQRNRQIAKIHLKRIPKAC